jgi:hypothetical protein
MHELASRALFLEQTKYLQGKLAEARGWVFHQLEYPLIEVTFTDSVKRRISSRMRWSCENWDDNPPSVTLMNATGVPLKCADPPAVEFWPNSSGIFNPTPHPGTGLPFICMAGILEYHTHPSHIGDAWDGYRTREGYDLGGLLSQVWNGWLKGGQ